MLASVLSKSGNYAFIIKHFQVCQRLYSEKVLNGNLTIQDKNLIWPDHGFEQLNKVMLLRKRYVCT